MITESMKKRAQKVGGKAVMHWALKKGDRFRLFVNFGCPGAKRSVTSQVYVHDDLDGCAFGHDEATGEHAIFTGEWPVVKLPKKGKKK